MAEHFEQERRAIAAQIRRIAAHLVAVLPGCAEMGPELAEMATRFELGTQTEHDFEALDRLHLLVLSMTHGLRRRTHAG